MALAPQIPVVDLKTQEARFSEANPRHGNASQAAMARRQVLLTLV